MSGTPALLLEIRKVLRMRKRLSLRGVVVYTIIVWEYSRASRFS